VRWKKRLIESLLDPKSHIFPGSLLIPRELIDISNGTLIEEKLLAGVQEGCWMGVRSIFSKDRSELGETPWVMDLNSPDKVNCFVTYTLPIWIEQNQYLEALSLMFNPRGISQFDRSDLFVARLQVGTEESILEIGMGTNQLRVLNTSSMESKTILKIHSSHTGVPESIEITMGKDTTTIGKETRKEIKNITPDLLHIPIKKTYSGKPEERASQDMYKSIVEQIQELQPHNCQFLLSLLHIISENNLVPIMRVLDEELQLNALEFQGVLMSDGIEPDIVIYGLQGDGDEKQRLYKRKVFRLSDQSSDS